MGETDMAGVLDADPPALRDAASRLADLAASVAAAGRAFPGDAPLADAPATAAALAARIAEWRAWTTASAATLQHAADALAFAAEAWEATDTAVAGMLLRNLPSSESR
ncbi:hypothetical protein BIV57_05300 [Mangrovactinospora gilvigrisea]|uniref:PE domain-containing protein n=1 Tax=Mangrovactinospora gilvigrisea TaxID=1428644 RepID=A0A1J7CAF9_9ACTN|nr:hypothetical protein [Mangrovactinospora gilvigrisea]OIV38500.1 hypothetical protein BIV57_05300 [Mangrovactinospora gilvigrisea]